MGQNTMGPKRRMPHADATYVASAERRHRLDHPTSGVEDVCGLGTGEPRHKNKTKQDKTPTSGRIGMSQFDTSIRRRTLLRAGFALGPSQVIAAPFIIAARGEEPVKIGMVNP